MRLVLLLDLLCLLSITAFLHIRPWPQYRSQFSIRSIQTDKLLEDIRQMRIGEIKNELAMRKISTKGFFEKEELIQRLYQARKEKPEMVDSQVLRTKLLLTKLDKSIEVAEMYDAVTITPSDQPYATIEIQTKGKSLYLLLDTACSGFVLRPQVVQRLGLPSLQTPVTMTGAAGTSAATGLTQLDSFTVGDEIFGPLPAAVQDIGALPASLDGIIGLSFLNQFAEVELNFQKGIVSFYKDAAPKRDDLIARGNMKMLGSLGIFSIPVHLGSRGPVQMLVDSGAAATFLSWKGVGDLGLSEKDSVIKPVSTPMGALGSDNVAIRLTHRLHVSSNVNLGTASFDGLSLSDKRLPIDIGQIPVIQGLESQGVGGILGIDVMMRCSAVRFSLKGQYAMEMYSK